MSARIPINVTVAQALKIAQRKCAAAGVSLVLPDDPRRYVVAGLIALAHKAKGTGVTFEHVRNNVTVTLPGMPGLATQAIRLIPEVGPILASFCEKLGQTSIFMSPETMKSGYAILAVIFHELGHAGDIKRNGLGWCLAYLIDADVRAGGETPCYGSSIAVGAYFSDPHIDYDSVVDGLAAEARESLKGYGLDADGLFLSNGLLDQAVRSIKKDHDFGGVIAELEAELRFDGLLAA